MTVATQVTTIGHIHHAPILTQAWQPQPLRGTRIIGLMKNAHALARTLAIIAIDTIVLENSLGHKVGHSGEPDGR